MKTVSKIELIFSSLVIVIFLGILFLIGKYQYEKMFDICKQHGRSKAECETILR